MVVENVTFSNQFDASSLSGQAVRILALKERSAFLEPES
jgi:hypothetical protein